MLKGLYILDPSSFDLIYGPAERQRIAELVHIQSPPLTSVAIRQDPKVLAETDVILSGWGAPRMDETFLAGATRLKAVFYGAGSIRGVVTEAFWQRRIRITSAYAMNAIPVAEYTLAIIILGLKRGWQFAMAIKRDGKYPPNSVV